MVASELDAVSSKWYKLGKELLHESDHKDLDSIFAQYSQNPKIALRNVISRRMEDDYIPPTWKDIIEGLRSLGDSQLADHLETKYCSSELTTT